MTKKIKHVSELPEWFQLKKYKEAKNLTTYGWHIQLAIRKYCMTIKDMSGLLTPVETIRKNIFIQIPDDESFKHWYDIISKINIDHSRKNKNPAVSSLTMRTFFNIQKILPPDRRTHQPELIDHIIEATQSAAPGTPYIDLSKAYIECLNTPKQEWLREPIYKSLPTHSETEGLVNINLDFTDDILIEQFKKWLSEIRSELNTPMKAKYFKQSDFNSWNLYGVLPYLDLKIWEREKDVSIPNRVMADAIYPQGVGGEETVRKTTAPLVEYLLSNLALNQLAGQTILENPEQK